jgi:hypothetical protein
VSSKARHIRQLHGRQHVAESQDEWMELAQKIDIIQGNDIWRTKKDCPLYESDKIQTRIDKFVSVKKIVCIHVLSETNAECMIYVI